MQFSVLISVYYKEKAAFFNEAFNSIWSKQTLKPDEIVLIKDGPLSKELDDAIDEWQEKIGRQLKVVALPQNRGLGSALNEGLKHCSFDFVARMDTDDMSLPDRFEKQINYIKKHPYVDVLGGSIEEFNEKPGDLKAFRILPSKGIKLLRYAKFRSPVNHPTIIFNKNKILSVGGYTGDILLFEDFVLFVKLINQGACFENLSDVLLNFRIGNGIATIKRRSGWRYALSELRFIRFAYGIRYLSFFEALISIVTKIPLRLLPPKVLLVIYKAMRH